MLLHGEKFYVSKEGFPIPLNDIDVQRHTKTNIDVLQEATIDVLQEATIDCPNPKLV